MSEGERVFLEHLANDSKQRKEWLECIEDWIVSGKSVKEQWQRVLNVVEVEFPEKTKPEWGPTKP